MFHFKTFFRAGISMYFLMPTEVPNKKINKFCNQMLAKVGNTLLPYPVHIVVHALSLL